MKKMTNKQIVKKYIGELDHFFGGHKYGGHPIRTKEEHSELVKNVPALAIQDDLLLLDDSHSPDSDLIAEFWKHKYETLHAQYEEMYGKIKRIVEGY